MPELPEVQATVDYLKERVEGSTIVRGHVSWGRSVSPTDPTQFEEEIVGATIIRVYRRGKYVCMQLKTSKTRFLCTHLRMSGSLDVVPTEFSLAPHDRVCLELNTGKSIRFNDTRKFGRMSLCDDLQAVVGHLGIEPLEDSFSPNVFYELLQSRKGSIKPTLLDQTVLAGLGNIYVDEVLWKTRIHPLTRVHTLTRKQVYALHVAIQETLHEAITRLGTDFGDGVVHGGMYRPRVYGRTGKKCLRCRGLIVKLVVGQRGTHICSSCQRARISRSSKQRKEK